MPQGGECAFRGDQRRLSFTPDANIDHRRVPNLMRFFERAGKKLAVTKNAADYKPGDIVSCLIPGNLAHIMLVCDTPSPGDAHRCQIIHNIGAGARAWRTGCSILKSPAITVTGSA